MCQYNCHVCICVNPYVAYVSVLVCFLNVAFCVFASLPKVPLNNKKALRQRSVSSEREDDGMEGLEEPLKAKKRKESTQQGIHFDCHRLHRAQIEIQ